MNPVSACFQCLRSTSWDRRVWCFWLVCDAESPVNPPVSILTGSARSDVRVIF